MNVIIEAKALGKTYQNQTTPVLKSLNLKVEKHEFIAIMGRSGCGKTTFLKILGLLNDATDGDIYFEGKNISELSEEETADIRRTCMGFVFQDYNLMNSLTVEENILLPAILNKTEPQVRQEKLKELVQSFQLEELMKKYPQDLSGGEKQRTALSRALINNPELILADEPTGNLDSIMGEAVISALENLYSEWGKTVIIVTHDPLIACCCEKVIFMKDGNFIKKIHKGDIEEGDTKRILYQKIIESIADL